MIEITTLKEKMDSLSEKNKRREQKMKKLEKDYSNLDNLFSKTQESNSHLLAENKATSEQLTIAQQRLREAGSYLESTNQEKESVEKSLIATNEELQQAYAALNEEKKEILQDLSKSKKMIVEYQVILEQGQVDFNDMEKQLEAYRRENVEFDKKLHKKSKDSVQLETEKNEMNRCMIMLSDEMSTLRTQMESQQRDCEVYLKEKENIEAKFLECKSREEYFEERLLGYEKLVHSKEALLSKEKKEKENMQDLVLKLQSELIVGKTQHQVLLAEKEERNKELIFKTQNVENLQEAASELSSQIDDLETKLNDSEKQLSECEEKYSRCKKERDELEKERSDMAHNLQHLEKELENERVQYHNEKGTLLADISQLKRNNLESEVMSEKHNYKEKLSGYSLKEAQETNDKLNRKIDELEQNKTELQEKLIETVRNWERKLKLIEEEKSIELIGMKASLEAVEETRRQDVSLLKIKLEETDELKREFGERDKLLEKKDSDNEALKDDIIQLQTSLNKSENAKKELEKKVEQLKVHVGYLEQNKQDIKAEKKELEDEVKMKVGSLKQLEEEKLSEYYEKRNLVAEHVALKESYEKALQIKDLEHKKISTENTSLKAKLNTLKNFTGANESLRNDFDSMQAEKKLLISENSQLRTENYEQRSSIEKIHEYISENKSLKQQLRASEMRHNETIDAANREKARLKKDYDDLFRSSQDVEVRDGGFMRQQTTSTYQSEARKQPKLNFRASSLDALDEIGIDVDSFSPGQNGVATSTPNQEASKITAALMTKSVSLEMLNPSNQRKLSDIDNQRQTSGIENVDSSMQKRSSSVDILHTVNIKKSPRPFDFKSVPSSQKDPTKPTTLPIKIDDSERTSEAEPLNTRKADASWRKEVEEERGPALSIKSNPFLRMDKMAKSANATLGAKSKSAPLMVAKKENNKKQVANEPSKYDLRSQSTDTALETPLYFLETPKKPANEYINRLKETFEKKR